MVPGRVGVAVGGQGLGGGGGEADAGSDADPSAAGGVGEGGGGAEGVEEPVFGAERAPVQIVGAQSGQDLGAPGRRQHIDRDSGGGVAGGLRPQVGPLLLGGGDEQVAVLAQIAGGAEALLEPLVELKAVGRECGEDGIPGLPPDASDGLGGRAGGEHGLGLEHQHVGAAGDG